MMKNQHYFVLRSFLTEEEQISLKDEAIGCHRQSSKENSFEPLTTSTSSLKLELGVACGANLEDQLPVCVKLCQKAFQTASHLHNIDCLETLASAELTGLALLYGPNASMPPHYDSPTQPGQRNEWLAMLTVGNAVDFVCDDQVETLFSGDALVMDSMAVLHGVKRIVPGSTNGSNTNAVKLPVSGSRLGLLMWKARKFHDNLNAVTMEVDLEGVTMLFGDDDDSD